MLADNGRGAILADKYNIKLLDNAVEKMITVNHSNQLDVWLVSYNRKNNSFYTYLIDKNGINKPIIQKRNEKDSVSFLNSVFNLDYDIKHKKLINCSRANFSFEIYDFDNSTGQINIKNALILPSYNFDAADTNAIDSSEFFIPYSAILSEDGTKFYGSCYRKSILQYDLALNDVEAISHSRFVVADSVNGDGAFGAIRRAPDDKIYISCDTSEYLSVINFPNKLAAKCEFIKKGVFLEGNRCRLGLPIMMNYSVPPCSFSGYAGEDKTICSNETIMLGDLADTTGLVFEWSPKKYLDDPFSLNPNCFALENITYVLKITDRNIDCFDFDTVNVTVLKAPKIEKSSDVSTCKNNPVTIGNNSNDDNLIYEWTPKIYLDDPNSKCPICKPEKAMTYIMIATNASGCKSYDTVKVSLKELDDIKIRGDEYICENDSTELYIEGNIISCKWNTGETTNTIIVKKAGTYIAEVVDASGCVGDISFEVKYFDKSAIKIIAPKTICEGVPVILSTSENFKTYLWNTGETTPSIEINTSGKYWVTVINKNGCVASDTVNISQKKIQYQITEQIALVSCIDERAEQIANISNQSKEVMLIEKVEFANKSNSLSIADEFLQKLPLEIDNNASHNFAVYFESDIENEITDTLLIKINQPCYAIIKIPIKAKSYLNTIDITSNDFRVTPGEDIKIPIKIKLNSNLNESEVGDLEFDYTFNSTILKVDKIDNGKILDVNKKNDLETITISVNSDDLKEGKVLFLYGKTFLGNKISTELKVDNVQSNLKCVKSTSPLNILELQGCAIDMRTISFTQPTKINIEKITSNSIILRASSQEVGEIIIRLVDVIGRTLYETKWIRNKSNFESKKIGINLNNLELGTYFVLLNSPKHSLAKKIILFY